MAGFSFAAVGLVVKYLGAEGYGGIVAVIAASQVAQIFVSWTCVALARYGVEEFVESGKINRSFWARTVIFLPNTLIFLAFSFLWLPLLSSWLKLPPEAGWYVGAHFLVTAVWLHVQHAIQGAKLPQLHGILLAVERVLIFSILLALMASGQIGFFSAVTAYIVPPTVMSLVGLFAIRKLFSWRVEVDVVWLKNILRFSLPLIPFSLVGYFSTNYLDAIFISQYLTKADLGIYSVAYQIAGILMQLPVLAGSLLMPLFVTMRAHKQEDLVDNYLKNALPLFTLAWGLGCLIFAMVAAILLPIAFGSEMAASSGLLLILMICSVVNAPLLIGYAPYINALSATYISAALAIAMALMNLVGNAVLIPKYGLAGSAWATVLAYTTSVIVASGLVHYRFKIPGGWSLQATAPAILALGYAWWSGNMLLGLAIGGVASLALVGLHWKSASKGGRFLLNYQSWLATNRGS